LAREVWLVSARSGDFRLESFAAPHKSKRKLANFSEELSGSKKELVDSSEELTNSERKLGGFLRGLADFVLKPPSFWLHLPNSLRCLPLEILGCGREKTPMRHGD